MSPLSGRPFIYVSLLKGRFTCWELLDAILHNVLWSGRKYEATKRRGSAREPLPRLHNGRRNNLATGEERRLSQAIILITGVLPFIVALGTGRLTRTSLLARLKPNNGQGLLATCVNQYAANMMTLGITIFS